MILSLDPGVNGGIASLSPNEAATACKMPSTKREIAAVLATLPRGSTAFLEELVKFTGRLMPSSSMAAYASNHGFLEGVLTALGCRIVIVPPKAWQKALGLGTTKSHASKTAWKNHLKNRASQLFPHLTVTLATADSLLILEAARRGLLG